MAKTSEELRLDAARQREQVGETVDAIGDRVSPGRIVERRTNRLRGGVADLRDRVMGSAEHARATVADTAGGAVHQAGSLPHDLADGATSRAAGNPLAAGAVAFGMGFLAAAAFPGTRAEGRAAQQLQTAAQPLVEEAKGIGSEAAEHLRGPAEDAVDHLKEVATDEAASVSDTARAQADSTASAGRSAAEDVRHTARP